MIQTAAAVIDIFQFTGLTRNKNGALRLDGAIEAIVERERWLAEAGRDRNDAIERSVLVQAVAVGDGADAAAQEAAAELGLDRETIDSTPFLLFGSVEQIIDELEQAGVIATKGRRGTFVLHARPSKPPETASGQLARAARAFAIEATQLGVSDTEALTAAQRALAELVSG